MLAFLTRLLNFSKTDIKNTDLDPNRLIKFKFYKEEISSLPALFEGIQFELVKNQRRIFNNQIVISEVIDWRKTGDIYFLDKKIRRDSDNYNNFLEEVMQSYIMNNPKLIKALVKTKDKDLYLTSLSDNKNEVLLTSSEYIGILTQLRTMLLSPIN